MQSRMRTCIVRVEFSLMSFSVPYYRQLETYDCAVSSVQMLLESCGIYVNRDELLALLAPDPETGTPRNKIIETIQKYGIRLRGGFMQLCDVQEALADEEFPILLNHRSFDDGKGHYSVATHVSSHNIFIHDPWLGPETERNFKVFEQYWYGHNAPDGDHGWCIIPEIPTDMNRTLARAHESSKV